MLPYSQIFTMMAAHKAAILAEGVRQAQMLAPGALPTLDMMKGACVGYAREIGKQWLLPGAIETLQGAVATYQTQMGPRPATPISAGDPDSIAWRDAFDEHIMDVIGKDMLRDIGQDFIGEWLTDSEIDNPDTLTRAAQVMTDRLLDAAVRGRANGALLAEMDITMTDLAPYGTPPSADQVKAAAIEAKPIDEAVARGHVERIVGAYGIKLGAANFDMVAVTELLKSAFDDEEFLALGYIETMGGKREDWPYFAAYAKASPTHIDDTVNAAFMAAITGQVVEMPKGAPKPPKEKKLTKKELALLAKGEAALKPPPLVVAEGTVSPPVVLAPGTVAKASEAADLRRVIELMREHGSDGEEALGKVLGVSRGTVNNIVKKGKAWVPTLEVQQAVIDLLDSRIKGLQEARDMLTPF